MGMSPSGLVGFGVLGPLEATLDGVPIDIGSPKQRAVLAMLLINANQPVTPDRLIDAIWGDHPPESALATLQVYISNLRKAIEPRREARTPARVLQKNGAGYQLAVTADQVDALEFEALLDKATGAADSASGQARGLLKKALSLWRGAPYGDFTYEEFTRVEISRLQELRLEAEELRFAIELREGHSADLVADLESLVDQYPLRERLWAHLMLALYRSGRQADALRAYRRCEEMLADMGISPGEELRDLELAILDQDASLAAPPKPLTAAKQDLAPVVGRKDERERFEALLAETATGTGSVVIVEGEAGAGKTKLLETFRQIARSRGVVTAFARCVEVGGTPPFWPWAQITRELGAERLAAMAGAQAGYLTPLLPGMAQTSTAPLFRVAEALAQSLKKVAADGPVALFIDDLYSSDPDSLSLLALLAAEIGSSPIVIVGSHRGRDSQAATPLQSILAELNRLPWAHRIALPRLDESEVADLIEHVTSQEPSRELARSVFEATEGNAFFAVELIKLLESKKGIDLTLASSVIPTTVLDVVTKRLGTISTEALEVIRCGAVLGREFDLKIVAEALGYDRAPSLAAIDDAAATGFVSETDQPGRFRFSHVIVVNGILHGLGSLRRSQLHLDVANVMERRFGADPPRWVEIAHHRVESIRIDGASEAIRALARAGDHAYRSNAMELAEDLFQRRHSLIVDEPPSHERDQLEIASLFDLGRVWSWREGFHSPRLREAAQRLWDLTGISSGDPVLDPGDDIDEMHPVLASFQARFSVETVSGNVRATLDIGQRLLELASRYPDPMVVYAANQAAMIAWLHAGQIREAIGAADKCREALTTLDPDKSRGIMLPLGQQPAWITFHSFAGWLYWLAGDPERARAELDEAWRLTTELDNPFVAGFAATIRGVVAVMSTVAPDLDETRSWSRKAAGGSAAVDRWLRLHEIWIESARGGDPAEAARAIESALDALEEDSTRVNHTLYRGLVAELALAAGDPEWALRSAASGISHAWETGEMFWCPELERLAGEAHRRMGRDDESHEALERARTLAADLGVTAITARLGATVEP